MTPSTTLPPPCPEPEPLPAVGSYCSEETPLDGVSRPSDPPQVGSDPLGVPTASDSPGEGFLQASLSVARSGQGGGKGSGNPPTWWCRFLLILVGLALLDHDERSLSVLLHLASRLFV